MLRPFFVIVRKVSVASEGLFRVVHASDESDSFCDWKSAVDWKLENCLGGSDSMRHQAYVE
jgi:hypothetical protein